MSASILASSTMTRPVVVSRTPQRSVCLGNVSGLRAASRHSQIKQRGSLLIMANEKQGKGGEEGGRKFDDSVFGKLAKSPNFTLLASSAVKAGLEPFLTGKGPLTLFAPNDDAFVAAAKTLGITKIELLALENLPEILKNHVVEGLVLSSDLSEGQEVKTVGGHVQKISLAGGVKVSGANVKKADFKATNGVIHVIDKVLTDI